MATRAEKRHRVNTQIRYTIYITLVLFFQKATNLHSLSSDSARQLQILRHYRNPLSVNGAQVSVLKKSNQVSLGGFLQSQESLRMETEIRLEVVRNLPNKSLERKLSDKELRRFLEFSDLSQGNGPWSVPVGLLDASRGGRRLAGGLRSELLSRGLSASRLSGSLLGSCHKCFLE